MLLFFGGGLLVLLVCAFFYRAQSVIEEANLDTRAATESFPVQSGGPVPMLSVAPLQPLPVGRAKLGFSDDKDALR